MVIQSRAEPDLIEEIDGAATPFRGGRLRCEEGRQHHVVERRQRGDQAESLKHDADRSATQVGHVVIVHAGELVAHDADFARIRFLEAGNDAEQRIAYSLEYGLDEMEMHADAIRPGERVILVDDLIATGGTAEGAVKLLRQMGAEVLAACFIIDLPELGGAAKLRKMDVPVRTLISFEGH